MPQNQCKNKFGSFLMKSSQIYGLLGSFLSGIIIVLLLMFVFMPFEKEEEEEGIMVSFGDGIEGLGETVAETATASPTPTKEELMTQEDKETVALEAQKKKEREEKRQQEMLIAEQKRQEAERAAKTDKARNAAEVLKKSVGGGQSSGSGTAGNPAGGGSSNGNDWSLSGRDLRGAIPRPEYNTNVEGIIVVSIRVDENGNVISATTNGKYEKEKGKNITTNITDRTLLEMTLAAAKKVKFSPGKNNVYGTIIYNFKLN